MTKSSLSLAFSTGMLLILLWMAWEAANFQQLASYFPLYISLFAIVFIMVDLITQIVKAKKIEDDKDEHKINKNDIITVFKYILWFVGYVFSMLVLGFLIGTVFFLLLFLIIETKFKLLKTVIITAITIGIIILLGQVMGLEWPGGIIGI